MEKVLRLVEERPSYRTLVVAEEDGRPITLGELVDRARAGDLKARQLLERLGMDPIPLATLTRLAAHFYRALDPNVRLAIMGFTLSPEEMARHVEMGTRLGQLLLKVYRESLRRAGIRA